MSSVDSLSLFLHVLAAATLLGGGIAQAMAGARVRSATSGRDVAQWATFTRSAGILLAAAALVSLMTGGHLAGAVWGGDRGGFSNPFITLGTLGWLLLLPVGPMVGGARLRRLAASAEPLGDAAVTDEVRAAASHPVTWGAVHSLLGGSAGLIWLMTAKPDWAAGAVGLVIFFALGWAAGVLVSRRPA